MKVAPQRIAQIESRFAQLELVDVAAKIRMTKISAPLREPLLLSFPRRRESMA